jgi:hypothetical protein
VVRIARALDGISCKFDPLCSLRASGAIRPCGSWAARHESEGDGSEQRRSVCCARATKVASVMSAVALGWYVMHLVSTSNCYVKRAFAVTAVTSISRLAHNPGFCNGPWFVNPSFHLRHPFAGVLLLSGVSAMGCHLMGFEEDSARRSSSPRSG